MKYRLTFALVAALASTAFAEFKAPLPEFKNEKQLAEWRAEMAAKAKAASSTSDVRSSTLDVPSAFYTGKPYVESSGAYAFKYRSYNPELARWTSEDPSGFPDGVNNCIYAPTPTSELDFAGLETRTFHSMSSLITYDWHYGSYLQDQNSSYYFQYRIRQVETSWEVVKEGAGTSSRGDGLTMSATVTATETWTNSLGLNVGFDGTLGSKITVGYNRTWGGSTGTGYGTSVSKIGNSEYGWSADILVAKAQVEREWQLLRLVNGSYISVDPSENSLGGGWRGATVLGSGYNGAAGFAWYTVE